MAEASKMTLKAIKLNKRLLSVKTTENSLVLNLADDLKYFDFSNFSSKTSDTDS